MSPGPPGPALRHARDPRVPLFGKTAHTQENRSFMPKQYFLKAFD